jgi:hypothetical protein
MGLMLLRGANVGSSASGGILEGQVASTHITPARER